MLKYVFTLPVIIMLCTTIHSEQIVLLSDPKVLAIPIRDDHEPLIDLRGQQIIAFGPSPEIPNNTDYTKVRQSVYEKLVEAQKMLPDNFKFCLYEGYRSLDLQKRLFNDRYEKLKKMYPFWRHEEIFIEATKLVSPVINLDGSNNIPPHSTGAAVDIYLINEKGEIVDMGISVENWMQDLDGSLSQTNSTKISDEAKRYRTLMCKVLTNAGFVNYPTEYWHWSYGDRYWAHHKKATYAIYGVVNDQPKQIESAIEKRGCMKQEVEIKIQITPEQLEILELWLDKNAKFIGLFNQKDYFLDNPRDSFYFTNADGKRDVLRFFRIRVASDGDSACYKNWHRDPETGISTHCDEIEIKVVDGMQMLELMQAVGFVNHYIKEKTRKEYVIPGFEILIDDVKDAGIFIEIEIDHQIIDVKAGIQSIYDLLRGIGITTFKKQIASCESKKMEVVNL